MDYQPNAARERNVMMQIAHDIAGLNKRQAIEYLIEGMAAKALYIDQLQEALSLSNQKLPDLVEVIKSTICEAVADCIPGKFDPIDGQKPRTHVISIAPPGGGTYYLRKKQFRQDLVEWSKHLSEAREFSCRMHALEFLLTIGVVAGDGGKLNVEPIGNGPEFNPSDVPTVVVKPPEDDRLFLIERKMDDDITLFYKGRTNVGGGVCWTSERDQAAHFTEHANAIAVTGKLSLRFADVSVQPFRA